MCSAPGMWPSSHSARSRTSTKSASPASRRSRAATASVSSISARTWARRSRYEAIASMSIARVFSPPQLLSIPCVASYARDRPRLRGLRPRRRRGRRRRRAPDGRSGPVHRRVRSGGARARARGARSRRQARPRPARRRAALRGGRPARCPQRVPGDPPDEPRLDRGADRRRGHLVAGKDRREAPGDRGRLPRQRGRAAQPSAWPFSRTAIPTRPGCNGPRRSSASPTRRRP